MTTRKIPGDEVLEILEEITVSDGREGAAIEVAADAVAFAQSFWTVMKEHNAVSGDVLDFNLLESGLDALLSELVAAAMFLSSDNFRSVPKILRETANRIEEQDVNKEVPVEVVLGYRRLATRIENTKLAKAHYSGLTPVDPGAKVQS